MNLNSVLCLIIIFLINFGCNKGSESNPFIPPKIINTHLQQHNKRSLHLDKHLSLSEPILIGKFEFGQLVDINPEILQEDTTYRNDFIPNKHSVELGDDFDYNGFDLFIDYAQNIFYRDPFDEIKALNPFDTVYYCYYPVYFVNSTNTDKIFPIDIQLNAVQEAKKGGTRYNAIEVTNFSFGCGNGTGALLVKPREYIIVLMKKYGGEKETELRVRFEIGQSVYVSKPFLGKIHPSQFQIEEKSLLHTFYENDDHWNRILYSSVGTVVQKQRIAGYDFPPIDSLVFPKGLDKFFKNNELYWTDKFDPIDIVIKPNKSDKGKYEYHVKFAGLVDFDHIGMKEWEKYLVDYIKNKKIKLNGTLQSDSSIVGCWLILDNERDLIKTVKLLIELLSNHHEISKLISKK